MEHVLSLVSALHAQKQTYTLIEGVIQAGSYDPAHGTVQVILGHTVAAAAFNDAAGQPIQPVVVGARLAVMGYGMQYGPIGGEGCIVLQCATQYIALIEYSKTDSPNTPSGETWVLHRVPTSPLTINASYKLTNDGATLGDGLGGFKVLAGGQGSLTTTGGISVVVDDTAETATISCGSGLQVQVNKTSGDVTVGGGSTTAVNITTSGSGSIGVGSSGVTFNGASASTGNGIVTQSHLVSFLSQLQTALTTWASANLQGGSGASGPSLSFTPTGSSASFST